MSNGMIYRTRTGCQWNHLPTEFGNDSTVHRTVCRWDKKGVFDRLWALLIYHCEELHAVHWEWQAADGCLNKARFIGKKGGQDQCVGPNPCDRGKSGVKKSVLAEGNGWPLAVCISGANTPDTKLLALTLDAVVVERPQPTEQRPQHLCLDKGYDNPTGEAAAAQFGYTPHIRRIGEEKLDAAGKRSTPPAAGWSSAPSPGGCALAGRMLH